MKRWSMRKEMSGIETAGMSWIVLVIEGFRARVQDEVLTTTSASRPPTAKASSTSTKIMR